MRLLSALLGLLLAMAACTPADGGFDAGARPEDAGGEPAVDGGGPEPDPMPDADGGNDESVCPDDLDLQEGVLARSWRSASGCTLRVTLTADAVIEAREVDAELELDGAPGDEPGVWGPAVVGAGGHALSLPPSTETRFFSLHHHGAPAPEIVEERSLVWTDGALLDDVVTLSRVMAAASDDGHGGRLLQAWFERFATTAHSERLGPLLLLEEIESDLGSDASQWDLDGLPFTTTGVHNRLDLKTDDSCGELRVSLASTHPIHEPLHLIFLFRQPPRPLDRTPQGTLHCQATARAWSALGALDDGAFTSAADAWVDAVLLPEHLIVSESLDFTIAPWEWRQWEKVDNPEAQTAPSLPFVLDNPPLFQTVDIPAVNAPGAVRDLFLAFVEENAAGLAERAVRIPEAFRARSARLNDGVPWVPLDLTGVDAAVLGSYPTLRQQIEIIGCPACHTADAAFVQTREDRTFSSFYDVELEARAEWLRSLAHGVPLPVGFGPLQPDPVLHP